MSKVRMKPLLGALLLLALLVSACIVVITIEIYSWDHYYYEISWWIHFPSCNTFYYYRWFEIWSWDYIRIDVVVIGRDFYENPCSDYYVDLYAAVEAESYVDLAFVNPVWNCSDPPDTAWVHASIDSGFISVSSYDGNAQIIGDVDFTFYAHAEPDTGIFACDNTVGYEEYALMGSFRMDFESQDSVYFDLWEGRLYWEGTKTLTSDTEVLQEVLMPDSTGVGMLTGIEYVMECDFEYPDPSAAEIVSFDATGFGDRIEVEWSTSAEINNAGFHVLRSESEKGPFKTVNDQFIPARGSELSGADYTFTDRGVAGGTTYFYRLEVVDVNGKVGYTEPVKSENKAVAFRLAQNYPNPFNPVTEIMYNLPTSCNVRLEVYNVLGQRIATLVNEHQKAGSKVVSWNGKDSVGNDVASGVYFYRINAGEFVEMKKMILLR
jgi:hypothetical protein